MSRSALSLGEVTIVAEEDPAYEMIRNAVKRRKANDPEKLDRFRYNAYNKAVIDVLKVGLDLRSPMVTLYFSYPINENSMLSASVFEGTAKL
jgi:hypothetical protein